MGNRLGLPLRGGSWNNATNAGVCALNFDNARANANHNIGFRAALSHRQMPPAHGPVVRAWG